MDSFRQYIEEIFDSKIDLIRDEEKEKLYKDHFYPHTLTNIEVHKGVHDGEEYEFLRHRHKGMWEVHFGTTQNENPSERLNKHKGSSSSKLISTAISLYKEKLDRGQPIRYYGSDDKIHKLYDSAFKHISKNDNLYSRTVKDFVGPDGTVHKSATEVSTYPDGDKLGIKESTFKLIQ